MMITNWFQRPGTVAILSGGGAAFIYCLMIFVTLAHLESISGHILFDMRPFGYGAPEAAQILKDLGQEGRSYYLTRQIPLDTLYPALLALMLVSATCWLGQNFRSGRFGYVAIAFSIAAALADYAENLGVASMILNWPDVAPVLVGATSVASVAKAVLTTVAVLSVSGLGVFTLYRRKASL